MRRTVLMTMAIVAAVSATAPAAAEQARRQQAAGTAPQQSVETQTPPPPGRPGGRAGRGAAALPDPDIMKPAEVDRYFDGMVVLEARNALQLSDELFFRFGPRLERLQNVRRRTEAERRRLVRELA